METKQKNTSSPEPALDPGNVIRCLNCDYRTYDITVDRCPNCDMIAAVVYEGNQHGPGCRECTQVKPRFIAALDDETFGITDERLGFFMFNVTDARRFLSQQPEHIKNQYKEKLPREFIAQLLYVNVTEPRHYEHIPADKLDEPGILCELELGNGYRTFVLIDGSHRAGDKMLKRQPFYAYVLPNAITKLFLMAHTPGTILDEPPLTS